MASSIPCSYDLTHMCDMNDAHDMAHMCGMTRMCGMVHGCDVLHIFAIDDSASE